MLSTNDFRINVASRTSKRAIKLNVAAGHYLINSRFFEQHISAGLLSFFVLDVPQIPQKCRVRRLRKGQPLVEQGIAPPSFPATAIFPRFACILSAWIKRSATDFAKTRSPLSSPFAARICIASARVFIGPCSANAALQMAVSSPR